MILDDRNTALVEPMIVLECESYSSLLAVLPSVDAVALVPRGFQERYGPIVGLVAIQIAEALPRVLLRAVWRADPPLSGPAADLLDGLEQEAATLRRATRPTAVSSDSRARRRPHK